MTMTIEGVQEPVWTDTTLDRCRSLVKAGESAAWELGDLILDILPVGKHGVNTGVAQAISALAVEVGGEPATLTQYRKVAHGWPEGCRHPSATWMAHKAYMGPPQSAAARRQTLDSLPRNEHGVITVKAVRDLTRGNTGGPKNHLERIGERTDYVRKDAKAWIDLAAYLAGKPAPVRAHQSLQRARAMHAEIVNLIDALWAGGEPNVDALREAAKV